MTASVVLGTRSGWSEIRTLVGELLEQAERVRGEIVVADGLGRPAPAGLAGQQRLQWIPAAGCGAFELRYQAIRASKGDIIVLTEDHCVPRSDWLERLVALHRTHQRIDVVKGSVQNGTRGQLIDRAAFTLVQWRNVPPLDRSEISRIVGVGGAAFKRRALERAMSAFPHLPPEMLSPGEIRGLGLTVHADESLAVTHLQHESWIDHGRLHFHNARAIAGMRRPRATARDWARVAGAPLLLPIRVARTIWRSRGRRDDSAARMIAPLTWLYLWKGAGECVGMFTGPGDSSARLH